MQNVRISADTANNAIVIPPGSTNVTIGPDGSVNYQTPTNTTNSFTVRRFCWLLLSL